MIVDENDFHKNWEKRLDYVISRANVQVADLHKNIEFIVQRATTFVGLYNIFLTTFMLIVASPIIKILAVLLFVFMFYKISPLFNTSRIPLQGMTSEIVDHTNILVTNGQESHLTPTGFFVDKDVSNESYYAWLIDSLKDKEAKLHKEVDRLADIYNNCVRLSKICTVVLIVAWAIATVFTASCATHSIPSGDLQPVCQVWNNLSP
jgi:hypothetical protein